MHGANPYPCSRCCCPNSTSGGVLEPTRRAPSIRGLRSALGPFLGEPRPKICQNAQLERPSNSPNRSPPRVRDPAAPPSEGLRSSPRLAVGRRRRGLRNRTKSSFLESSRRAPQVTLDGRIHRHPTPTPPLSIRIQQTTIRCTFLISLFEMSARKASRKGAQICFSRTPVSAKFASLCYYFFT